MFNRHSTLTANVVSTIGPLSNNESVIELVNRSTFELYATIDGSTPVLAGNDVDCVPAGVGQSVILRRQTASPITVRVLSSGAAAYTVRAIG